MNILFVNCCLRGEASRTLRLCRVAVAQLKAQFPGAEVTELVLDEEDVQPLNGARLAHRHELEKQEKFDDPVFRYARQFAQADLIVMGAPYWEYQFPAMLRCYLEQVSVCGVTFVYTDEGRPKGLCKANRLLYITTAGGPILHRNCGFDYVKTLCGDMFGFTDLDYVAAESLDVIGVDVEAVLQDAEARLREKLSY